MKKLMQLGVCIFMLAAGAAAQTVTGSGTTNTVPVFTGTSTVGNSPITVSGSNVGIGTTNPYYALDIQRGDARIYGTANYSPCIGAMARLFFGDSNAGVAGLCGYGLRFGVFKPSGNGSIGVDSMDAMTIQEVTGNVGIGTTSPGYTLDVAGQIHSSTGGYVFPDGTTQTTAFIPANCGADYAEAVDVTGDRTKYEPGDLLVIDPDHPGKFLKANQPYSTMVAGIYSTKPGFVGRKQAASDPASKDEVPMAMVGRVPTKVSAENGPIHVGDLLVTSSTMGYAMKGTDRSQMLGAVVGKALGSLDSGTGVIEVLVTLQ